MTIRYSLRTNAELKNLSQIRDFVEAAAIGLGFGSDLVSNVQLAVDEAATNVMLHGYRGQGGSLEIELERVDLDLIVRLRDEAPPFDPRTVPSPDLTLPLPKRPIGGLGVHLLRRTMDEIIHQVTPAGGNELTLIKRNAADG